MYFKISYPTRDTSPLAEIVSGENVETFLRESSDVPVEVREAFERIYGAQRGKLAALLNDKARNPWAGIFIHTDLPGLHIRMHAGYPKTGAGVLKNNEQQEEENWTE